MPRHRQDDAFLEALNSQNPIKDFFEKFEDNRDLYNQQIAQQREMFDLDHVLQTDREKEHKQKIKDAYAKARKRRKNKRKK